MDAQPRPRQPPTARSKGSRWRAPLAAGCAIAGVAALIVAWQHPGFPEVPPQPVDNSVWVANDSRLLVGRINTDIGELDSAAVARPAAQVVQDPTVASAGAVLVVDQGKHELQVLNTVTVTFGTRASIPENATVQAGGGTLAVADPQDGRLWVGDGTAVESVDARLVDPKATVGPLPVMAISTQGTVVATAPGATDLVSVPRGSDPIRRPYSDGPLSLGDPTLADPTGPAAAGGSSTLRGSAGARDIQLTTVGETAVVLDRADSALRVDGRRIALPALAGPVLQQPGPAAADVLIGTADGLVEVGLEDGAVRTVAQAAGAPVAPVRSGDCRFGAFVPEPANPAAGNPFAGSPPTEAGAVRAVAVCGGDDPQVTELANSGDAAAPAFRQRGTAVVLADNSSGKSWVATDHFRPVDNWADVDPNTSNGAGNATPASRTANADLPRLPPDCTGIQAGKPQAADDTYGVRAGRATVLRVLDNDPGVDCAAVVIASVSGLPSEAGSVAIVAGGSAIQVTVPATAAGPLPPIEYQVDNGIGDTATAAVAVSVLSDNADSATPEPVRRSAASTEVNGTVSYNVLDDYFSPTGDDLFLLSATADSAADVVSFRPDGTITYHNTGDGVGMDTSVAFVISDGTSQAAGTLTVAIAPPQSTTPVVYPVFTRAVIGSTARADPQRSVVSASPDPVRISTVQPEPGSEAATAQLDPQTGQVSITATTPGSYYLTFEAATGGRAVTGVLRADFAAPDDQSRTVVPMADVGYLTPGGQTVLDPLANDTDPDGEGLAVRQVDLPADAPVTAAVLDLHLIRVSAQRALAQPAIFTYQVFDGASTQTGQIRIVPIPQPRKVPPPLAAPIAATVRAGDAVTIPVSRFASSQDGSPVTAELDPAQLAALPGRAISTGDTIRYLAPADAAPGLVSFSYTAVAGSSTPVQPVQTVSTVSITVTSADAARNSAPNPPPTTTARVFAGAAISIPVPLQGIDPDGDWVVLQSIETPEKPLGKVSISDPDTLSYGAFDTPGLDRIRYRASDPNGQTVIGELTVLVVAPGESARPPVAPDLNVSVRPGGTIRIDPLAAVVDPGGQEVIFGSPAFTATANLQVQVDNESLIVTAPAEPTVASLRYSVVNKKGLTASGSVHITVSADARSPAPVAKDVFVRPADLATNNRTVDVDVSGSITNLSGRRDQLTVGVDPLSAGQAVMTGPQTLRVTVAAVRTIVAYQVTDTFGSTVSAFIVVPPQQQLVGPQVIPDAGPIKLTAGVSAEVAIEKYVTVGGGGEPTIAPGRDLTFAQGTAIRTSSTTMRLSALSTAGGAAAVYVPIDDVAGSVVVLTLPVQITPRLVPPPKVDSAELQVEAGGTGSIELAALTTAADDKQRASLTYSVGSGPSGIQAGIDGTVLTVTVRPDVARGTVARLPIEVVDDDDRDGKAVLTVTVTGSQKPLATVVDQLVTQGRAGVEVAADLLAGSIDPIGLGLTVSGVTVVEGAGGIAAGPAVSGSTVRLTPAAGYVGDIVVAAAIVDGTADPARTVTATLRVSIQDRPSAPGVPTLVDGTRTARSVQLAWAAADAHGAAIDGYTVTSGGIRQDCPGSATSCVITGLAPGQPYVFVVTARNAVGESAASAPSASIVPDAAPPAPAAPLAQYVAKGQLSVTWTAPTGDFTPITGVSLQIVANDSVVEVRDNVSSPLLLTDLDPGAAYRFQLRATNQQGTGDWSPASDAITPSGTPAAPAGLTSTFVYDTGQRGIAVSWSAPVDTGGEPVQAYRLTLSTGESFTGGGDFLSQFVTVSSDTPVSASVVASNSRGDGPPAVGGTVTPFSRPSAVGGLAVAASDRTLRATWNPADSPGRPIDHYDYRLNGGGWVSAGAEQSAAIGSLTNGQTYTVEVRACNGETGYIEDVRCGPPSAGVTGVPFGALAAPTLTVALADQWGQTVTAGWTFPDGNGRTVTGRTVQVTGAVTANPNPADGSWSKDIGFSATVTVTARYCVTGPDECAEVTQQSPSTPTPVSLAVLALDPLDGTCGVDQPYPGAWRTESQCGQGAWITAPKPIGVLCRTTGPSYPQTPADGGSTPPSTPPTTPPSSTPPPASPPSSSSPVEQSTSWYFATSKKWFRATAVTQPSRTNIPTC